MKNFGVSIPIGLRRPFLPQPDEKFLLGPKFVFNPHRLRRPFCQHPHVSQVTRMVSISHRAPQAILPSRYRVCGKRWVCFNSIGLRRHFAEEELSLDGKHKLFHPHRVRRPFCCCLSA